MFYDFHNTFDVAAAITVTRNSTNVIDLLRANQDIGAGVPLQIMVSVTTTFTAAGAATLQIALVTDDNAALTSPATLQDQVAVIAVATLVAGFEVPFFIHPSGIMERYLGIVYTVATGPMTAGAIQAGVLKTIQRWRAYPKNYVTA